MPNTDALFYQKEFVVFQ